MDELLGKTVTVETDDGIYTGILGSVRPRSNLVHLTDVFDSTSGVYLQSAEFTSYKNVTVVRTPKPSTPGSSPNRESSDGGLSEHETSPEHYRTPEEIGGNQKSPRCSPGFEVPEEKKDDPLFRNYRPTRFLKAEPQPAHLASLVDPRQRPSLSQLLESLTVDGDDGVDVNTRSYSKEHVEFINSPLECVQARVSLKQCNILGLSVFGKLEERPGEISLLCFSKLGDDGETNKCIVIDMCANGVVNPLMADCFREILESTSILKVCAESGILSDVLNNNFKIKLQNVFDVQVVDGYIAAGPESNYTPQVLMPMSMLLQFYLDIRNRSDHVLKSEADHECWFQRPLHPYLMGIAVRETRPLLSLQKSLQNRLNARAATLCNAKLNQYRVNQIGNLSYQQCSPVPVSPDLLLDTRQKMGNRMHRNGRLLIRPCGMPHEKRRTPPPCMSDPRTSSGYVSSSGFRKSSFTGVR